MFIFHFSIFVMKTILIFQPRRPLWAQYPRCPPPASKAPPSILSSAAPTWWSSSPVAVPPPWQGWPRPCRSRPGARQTSSEQPTARRGHCRAQGLLGVGPHTRRSSPTTGPCTPATTPNRPRPWSLTIPLPGKPSSIISDTLAKYVFICDTISLTRMTSPFWTESRLLSRRIAWTLPSV